jgi:hypothetical protein
MEEIDRSRYGGSLRFPRDGTEPEIIFLLDTTMIRIHYEDDMDHYEEGESY